MREKPLPIVDSAWRQAVSDLRDFHRTLRNGGTLKEGVVVTMLEENRSKSFRTACWFWANYPRPGTHRIYVSEFVKRLFSPSDPRRQRVSDFSKYLLAFYKHEVGHALYSIRQSKERQELMRRLNLSHSVWNLFEDARIECLLRKRFGRFNWDLYEDHKEMHRGMENPSTAFSLWIFHEGDLKGLDLYRLAGKNQKKLFDRCGIYYQRAIRARDGVVLARIASEFQREFLDSCPGFMPGLFDILNMDLGVMAGDPGVSILVQDPGSAPPSKGDYNDDPELYPIVDARQGNLMMEEPQEVDPCVGALVTTVRKLAKPVQQKVYSQTPRKRIDARRFVLSKPEFYRTKVEGKEVTPPKIAVIMDCSGSMGEVSKHGRAFVMALQQLAHQGFLSGYVILSGAGFQEGEYATAVHQSFNLKEGFDASRIAACCNSECIDFTIRETLPILQSADRILVYTDGNIVDEPVDRAYTRKKGLYIYGFCVHESEHAQKVLMNLHKHFDHGVVRDNIVNLVEALVSLIGLKPKSA